MPDILLPAKDGGTFAAYVARPEKRPAGAIIVIQEIFGVNAGIREKCDWLAGEGFLAVAPDLFWRMEPGVQLTDKTEGDMAKAFDFFNRFDIDKGIEDLKATRHTFKGHAESTGKVGCLGYCLGGKMSFLLACRADMDAAVGYYGVGLDQLLPETRTLKKPLLLHMAGKDKFVPPEAQEKIKAGLFEHPNVFIREYPDMDHAFTRVGGEHYDALNAKMADVRTVEFFKKHLR